AGTVRLPREQLVQQRLPLLVRARLSRKRGAELQGLRVRGKLTQGAAGGEEGPLGVLQRPLPDLRELLQEGQPFGRIGGHRDARLAKMGPAPLPLLPVQLLPEERERLPGRRRIRERNLLEPGEGARVQRASRQDLPEAAQGPGAVRQTGGQEPREL